MIYSQGELVPVRLDASYRAAALRHVAAHEVDVLVIGGGVVGTGAGLDAASRGLSVALVEKTDWGAGTSGMSSKLIHGGLRYLQQGNIRLVREALRERGRLLRRTAPHLVRPVPFVYPLRHRLWERLYVGAGLVLYDTLGGAGSLPRHRHLGRRAALELVPALRRGTLTGAVRYYDAQVDDARLAMMLARTAAQHAAAVLTRTEVTALLRSGSRVCGALVRDIESGRDIEVRARCVVSATGAWTRDIQETTGSPRPFDLRASKGVHILVPRERIPMSAGLISRTEKSVLLIIPWGRHWIIGTTDTPWRDRSSKPTPDQDDVDYLLDHLNALVVRPLGRADVVGVYAGLRALLAGRADDTARLSREHGVAEPEPGLVVVAGGKLTTYRVMAADAIDTAVRRLGAPRMPSVTDTLPIFGTAGFDTTRDAATTLSVRGGLSAGHVERLLGRYGSAVVELMEMIEQDPELAAPIPGAESYLKVEAVYAASHEGALHLDDILVRRTRISIECPDGGSAAAHSVATLVGPVLGWNADTRQAEVNRYRQQAATERAATQAGGDAVPTTGGSRLAGEDH